VRPFIGAGSAGRRPRRRADRAGAQLAPSRRRSARRADARRRRATAPRAPLSSKAASAPAIARAGGLIDGRDETHRWASGRSATSSTPLTVTTDVASSIADAVVTRLLPAPSAVAGSGGA
jgi:hypothetical protein